MIYIFSGCKEVCHIPARLCAPVEKLFTEGPLAECCSALSNCFADFFNRPLGGYVFMAFWIGALELGLCVYALVNLERLQPCRFQDDWGEEVGMLIWLIAQAAFALLHIAFAPYMQWQLWKRLNEEAREPDNPDATLTPSNRTKLANTEDGQVAASKHDIKEAFKEVFLHDCGVLLYIVALVGSFAWSFMGDKWIATDKENCDIDSVPDWTALVGMFFPAFIILYGISWFCMMSCMDEGTTLILRHGVTAVGAMAAAGKNGGKLDIVRAGANALTNSNQPQGGTTHGGGVMSSGASKGHKYTAVADNNKEDNSKAPPKKPSRVKSFAKLLACLGLDAMGNASYFLPGVGEVGDAVYAPTQAVMLKMMFNANLTAMFGLAEELAPYTDIVPTATIAWLLETCAPNSVFTRCMGINSQWAMAGSNSGKY